MNAPQPSNAAADAVGNPAATNGVRVVPQLPPEVLGIILPFSVPLDPQKRWGWLETVSSVDPDWVQVAEEHLAPTSLRLERDRELEEARAGRGMELLRNEEFTGEGSNDIRCHVAIATQDDFVQSVREAPWKVSKVTYLCAEVRIDETWELLGMPGLFPRVEKVTLFATFSEPAHPDFFERLYNLNQNVPLLMDLQLQNFHIEHVNDPLHVMSMEHLSTLRLSNMTGSTNLLEPFLLYQGSRLRVLVIGNCQLRDYYGYLNPISDQDLHIVQQRCKSLETLHVTQTRCSFECILSILQVNPGIVDLDISGHVDERDFHGESFIGSLAQCAPRLQSFGAHGGFNDALLIQLVKSSPSLHTINVRESMVTSNGLKEALKLSPILGRGQGTIESQMSDRGFEEFSEVNFSRQTWVFLDI